MPATGQIVVVSRFAVTYQGVLNWHNVLISHTLAGKPNHIGRRAMSRKLFLAVLCFIGSVGAAELRSGDIKPEYSGCQAVFISGPNQEVRLAWLVEISHGDPIRLWSSDEEMRAVLSCRYKGRKLHHGDAKACPAAELLLMPTQPAGCGTRKMKGEKCDYDVE